MAPRWDRLGRHDQAEDLLSNRPAEPGAGMTVGAVGGPGRSGQRGAQVPVPGRGGAFALAGGLVAAGRQPADAASPAGQVLTGAPDNEEITEWVAALAIGNAELVSCVRMTDEDRPRLLENRRLTAGLHPIKAMEPAPA